MSANAGPEPKSAFAEHGLKETVRRLRTEIAEVYASDSIPWVVGYSGGKDSTAVLQLVWGALASIPPQERQKPVYVISTDTLVENPIVAAWVSNSLDTMRHAATSQGLPIDPRRLTPEVSDTFWVNLIGRGYPAPRHKFRWCTERLKIKPSNRFINSVVRDNGEAIVVLGTRKAESSGRSSRMSRLEQSRVRDHLSPNASLPNSLVYTPVANWSNDEVWLFLMQESNPWGWKNKDLLTMYAGASEDGECPLVIDTTTPSCGDSRFGCWVCTLVERDRSMTAMIQNDEEKEWMLPLLELRNELDVKDDRDLRDFRRLAGHVQLFMDRPIPGPYTQQARETWLRKVLEAQQHIRLHGPEHVRQLELITPAELEEIRRIWVIDKHEIEDNVPTIYEAVLKQPFPGASLDDNHAFRADEMKVLRELADGDDLHFELCRELLDVEARYRTAARRAGLFDALEAAFRRSAFEGMEDATARARLRRNALEAARAMDRDQLALELEGGPRRQDDR